MKKTWKWQRKLRQYLNEEYNRLSLNPFLVRSDYFDCKIDEFWKFFLRKNSQNRGAKYYI